MIGTPRISPLVFVALGAGLVVGCVCPPECAPRSRALGPIADLMHEKGPATLSLAGVVRDDQGQPIPAVWIEVEGHPRPFQVPPAWRTDVRGRFEIHDLPAGPVKLLVTPGDLYSTGAETKVVETRTGVHNLVVVLDPGRQLLLRIVDFVPGPQERGARVTWEDPDGKRDHRWAPIRADGWVRFVALPPDRELEVWAEAEINRRHVRARSLKPGPTEQRIERHEVKDIAGRIRGSEARLNQRIEEAVGPLRERLRVGVYPSTPGGVFWNFQVAHTWVRKDGSFRLHGLPPGAYLVYVGTGAGEIFGVSEIIEAGTTDAIIDIEGPRSYPPG